MRGLVAAVQGLPKVGAAAAVDGDDVFDDGVDSWAELGAFGDGGDADRGGKLEVPHYVDDQEFGAEGVEHACLWHGEEADGGVGGDRAAGYIISILTWKTVRY